MKIIISPAKKMNTDTDSFSFIDYPIFLNRTEELLSILKPCPMNSLKISGNAMIILQTSIMKDLIKWI